MTASEVTPVRPTHVFQCRRTQLHLLGVTRGDDEWATETGTVVQDCGSVRGGRCTADAAREVRDGREEAPAEPVHLAAVERVGPVIHDGVDDEVEAEYEVERHDDGQGGDPGDPGVGEAGVAGHVAEDVDEGVGEGEEE